MLSSVAPACDPEPQPATTSNPNAPVNVPVNVPARVNVPTAPITTPPAPTPEAAPLTAGRQLTIPASLELTGLGCGLFAMIGAGLASLDTLPAPQPGTRVDAAPFDRGLVNRFAATVERCRNWRQ